MKGLEGFGERKRTWRQLLPRIPKFSGVWGMIMVGVGDRDHW